MRPHLYLLALFLLACSAFGQTAPARPRPASPAPSKSAAAKPAPKLSDRELETVIRAKFAKSKSANQFKVHVQGGVATIEGKTEVIQHKGAATRMAKVAGAVMVNNKVEVSEAARKNASNNLEEGRRRVQVKRGEARSDR